MTANYTLPKCFNVTGPCIPGEHYMLDAAARLPEMYCLAMQKKYFVLHAPQQSGRTTLIKSVAKRINIEGKFLALCCSLETLDNISELGLGIPGILDALAFALQRSTMPELNMATCDRRKHTPLLAVHDALCQLCASLDKPLIIFFDEIDCLSDAIYQSFLHQLRVGYTHRDTSPFPWSIVLVCVRNVTAFKSSVQADGKMRGTTVPFNIISESLTLADFTLDEISRLYHQHTEATGQAFEENAIERAWYWTEGQPWLVNALARQIEDRKRWPA